MHFSNQNLPIEAFLVSRSFFWQKGKILAAEDRLFAFPGEVSGHATASG